MISYGYIFEVTDCDLKERSGLYPLLKPMADKWRKFSPAILRKKIYNFSNKPNAKFSEDKMKFFSITLC